MVANSGRKITHRSVPAKLNCGDSSFVCLTRIYFKDKYIKHSLIGLVSSSFFVLLACTYMCPAVYSQSDDASILNSNQILFPKDSISINKNLDRINRSAERMKDISNVDLKYLLTIVESYSLPPSIRSEALKPLSFLGANNIEQPQKDDIFKVLRRILTTEDVKIDPKGYVKLYACSLIWQSIPELRYSVYLTPLVNDSRRSVTASAAYALKKIRLQKNLTK